MKKTLLLSLMLLIGELLVSQNPYLSFVEKENENYLYSIGAKSFEECLKTGEIEYHSTSIGTTCIITTNQKCFSEIILIAERDNNGKLICKEIEVVYEQRQLVLQKDENTKIWWQATNIINTSPE